MLKVCIVAHNAYGALTGENSGHIGGVERQTALLSQWLQENNFAVSVLTWDEGGPKEEVVNGIKIIKICEINAGLPGIRFFTPRWTSLNSAMAKADADIYYHNCCEHITGQVALWCQLKQRKFIFSTSSDSNCDIDLPTLNSYRERILYRYGLKHADAIITQSKSQQSALLNNFKLNSQTIPMPATPPQPDGTSDEERYAKKQLLWVGRIDQNKRADWMIEIGSTIEQHQTLIVGPFNDSPDYSNQIEQQLSNAANVKHLGKISVDNMPAIYQQCSVFCSTSVFEGFPNTFLEAWSYGLPIISTVDPDGVIERYKLGFHVSSKTDFIERLNSLVNNQALWQEYSNNARNYYQANHQLDSVLSKVGKLFRAINAPAQ